MGSLAAMSSEIDWPASFCRAGWTSSTAVAGAAPTGLRRTTFRIVWLRIVMPPLYRAPVPGSLRTPG